MAHRRKQDEYRRRGPLFSGETILLSDSSPFLFPLYCSCRTDKGRAAPPWGVPFRSDSDWKQSQFEDQEQEDGCRGCGWRMHARVHIQGEIFKATNVRRMLDMQSRCPCCYSNLREWRGQACRQKSQKLM